MEEVKAMGEDMIHPSKPPYHPPKKNASKKKPENEA